MYSNEVLDREFQLVFKNKLRELRIMYDERELYRIHYNDLLLMGTFLVKIKPKSHTRIHKISILIYSQYFIDKKMSKIGNSEIQTCVHKNLIPISDYLTKFGFKEKGVWLIIALAIFVIECIVVFILFDNFYFYIPVISLTYSIYAYIKEYRLDKNGKLLRLLYRFKIMTSLTTARARSSSRSD